jgi:lipopolysaccharide cholinephosphotransferase
MHNGIFVDIFPFDNVPDDPKEAKRQGRRYFLCKRLLWVKKGMGENMRRESMKQALRYYAFWMFAHLFRYESIKSYFKRIQTKYNGQNSKRVVADGSYSYDKESLDRRWVTNLELVKFETEEFLSFKQRTEYLTHFYGDYMKLPPKEKRNRHLLLNVDFGNYN